MRNSPYKNIFITALILILISSCAPAVLKSSAYKELYKEKPVAILIMPPINKSTNVEAKGYFHSTLTVPIANQGYYVIPAFLSMEILKTESAYDSELFINGPLTKFGEIFGADALFFTIIHKWNKSAIGASVTVDIEYILKSTKTAKILYTRRGTLVYNTASNSGGNVYANIASSLIKTAMADYVILARKCNGYTLSDLPAGNYSPKYKIDGKEPAGRKVFKATIQ